MDFLVLLPFFVFFCFFLMKLFFFIPTTLKNGATDTKPWELIKVPTALVNILIEDGMAVLSTASNTSRFKAFSHNSRRRNLIDLTVDFLVIPCALLGITVSARVFEIGEIRVLLWTKNPNFSNLRLTRYIGAQRTTYGVTTFPNLFFYGTINTVTIRISYDLYNFFLSQGVISEDVKTSI